MRFLEKKKKKDHSVLIKESKFLPDRVTTLICRIKTQNRKLLIALHSIHQVHIATF